MRLLKQEDPNDPYSAYYCDYSDDQPPSGLEGCSTMRQLFQDKVSKYASRPCLGHRKILKKVTELVDGKEFVKKDLENEYTWISYEETSTRVEAIAVGLAALGVKSQDNVAIMMETRIEWFLTSNAIHKLGAVIGTIYANLGRAGIIHCLNELESQVLVTSNDLLPLIVKVSPSLKYLKHVIVVRDVVADKLDDLSTKNTGALDVATFDDLLTKYEGHRPTDSELSHQDLAVIMYTSGSTGVPKGVLLPHESCLPILHTLLLEHGEFLQSKEGVKHASYLPMAHIFEFMATVLHFSIGIPVAFSSPLTLMENPLAFINPSKNMSDIELIQPSMFVSVPIMLDRLRSKVKTVLSSLGMEQESEEQPLPEKIRQMFLKKLGGRVQRVLCGGASFPESIHRWTANALGLHVFVIYASTESVGLGTSTCLNDGKYGYVGIPHGSLIKLEDWEDAGYSAKDKPCARGEIMISGKISYGYFKNEEETRNNFVTDAQGRRWWRSGDIGSIDSDGYIRIIDRKKDLVKPPRGEYISPAAIEAEIKSSPFVGNVCVCARSDKNFVVGLVLPNRVTLVTLAESLGIAKDTAYEDICKDKRVVSAVKSHFLDIMKDSKLSSIEKPRRIKLCTEDWTPDNGLVTAAFKIRRRQLHDFYKNDLDEMFTESEVNGNSKKKENDVPLDQNANKTV